MQSGAARQSLRSRQRGGCHRAGAIDAARRAAPAPRRPVPGPLTRRHPTLGRPLSHRAGAGAEASKSARENALHGLVSCRPLRLNERDAPVSGDRTTYWPLADAPASLRYIPGNAKVTFFGSLGTSMTDRQYRLPTALLWGRFACSLDTEDRRRVDRDISIRTCQGLFFSICT